MTKLSAFDRALSSMNSDERTRAQRLREALRLRDDDAVWDFCAMAKGFDKALRDIPSKCSEAAEHVARSEFGPSVSSGPPRTAKDPARGTLLVLALASLFVASIVLIGSTGFTMGKILMHGSAPWMPGDIASQGVVSYVATATLTAPVGGFLALLAVLQIALGAVALRLGRSMRRS